MESMSIIIHSCNYARHHALFGSVAKLDSDSIGPWIRSQEG